MADDGTAPVQTDGGRRPRLRTPGMPDAMLDPTTAVGGHGPGRWEVDMSTVGLGWETLPHKVHTTWDGPR
jgi:hypothetical protein